MTIYDLTADQALEVAQIVMAEGAEDFIPEEVHVDTPKVLQTGLLVPISFRCWEGDLWLSPTKGGMALRDDNEAEVKMHKATMLKVTSYLVGKGIW